MDENEIAKKVEHLFETGSEDDSMWRVISGFAAQFDALQILALTKLKFVSGIVKKEEVKKRLTDFIDYYKLLHNNRDTARFMLLMMEANALKTYMRGIEGKVNVQK